MGDVAADEAMADASAPGGDGSGAASAAVEDPCALPEAQGLGIGGALWHNEGENTQKIYVDRQFFASYEDQVRALRGSTTVYVGNISFYTTEAQIYALAAACGPVKRVVMGLNRKTKTPCGFAFVEHYTASAALENVARLSGLVLDDRPLRSELDFGFRDGRQYGRGASGGQVRDDRRLVYDAARADRATADADADALGPAPVENADAREKRKRRFATDDEAGGVDDARAGGAGDADADDAPAVGAKRRRRDDDDDDDASASEDD